MLPNPGEKMDFQLACKKLPQLFSFIRPPDVHFVATTWIAKTRGFYFEVEQVLYTTQPSVEA